MCDKSRDIELSSPIRSGGEHSVGQRKIRQATFSAAGQAINLTTNGALNNFTGTVNLTGATTTITDANALTLGTLATGNLTALSTGLLNLGQGTVTGSLTANSGGFAISQSGALTVTGTSGLTATAEDHHRTPDISHGRDHAHGLR